MTGDNQRERLSTSALARALDLPLPQLFATLKDYGWINKTEQGWQLTAKGEFEGGEYVHSQRYGRYIVWPQGLLEHPLLTALEDNKTLSATAIGQTAGLSPRQVNRIFAELGWIKHGPQGWEVTATGSELGGVQLENENSGTFYVAWPQRIVEQPLLQQRLQLNQQIFAAVAPEAEAEQDLFSSDKPLLAPDGHQHSDPALLQICHWLYSNGIAHGCQQLLPLAEEEQLYCDFYLPRYQLFIEYWPSQVDSHSLSQRLQRKQIYAQRQWPVLIIEQRQLPELEELLTRFLRQQGVRIY